jgi:tryptophan synthase alpha subunit
MRKDNILPIIDVLLQVEVPVTVSYVYEHYQLWNKMSYIVFISCISALEKINCVTQKKQPIYRSRMNMITDINNNKLSLLKKEIEETRFKYYKISLYGQ